MHLILGVFMAIIVSLAASFTSCTVNGMLVIDFKQMKSISNLSKSENRKKVKNTNSKVFNKTQQ